MTSLATSTRERQFLLPIVFLCLAGGLGAQPWSGIINPVRAVDWSSVGVPGGIPNRATICATLLAGATPSQISSAIQSCPAGQAVKLGAGTFNLNGGVTFNNRSNVTLRGSGADQTKLVFSGNPVGCHGLSADICVDSTDTNWNGGPSHTATFSGSGPWPRGTTQITLSSTTGLSVGDPITLDQLNDTSDSGGIYVCETVAGGCNDDGPSGGSSGGQRTDRAQQQLVTVSAINGNQITFSPGLYMPNWRSSQSPGAWWADNPIFSSGVEDISMDHTAASPYAGISLFNCQGCWVKGVRSLNTNRSHVLAYQSNKITIRDSYFYGTKNAVSQSYGIEIYPSSDSLIENNIFQHITAPQMINASCSGCVIGFNYSIDDYYVASPRWLSHSVFMHAGGVDNVLLEGNVGAGMYSDLFHGTHHFVTAFRNRYNGWETTKTDNTQPFNLWPFSRFYNLIGNVLGEPGYHNSYQGTPASWTGKVIYVLGTGTNCCQSGDPNVATTLFRWGNYDVVNNATRWLASEVPTGLALYANSVPASQTLPNSFYLSGKPAWFGSVPWPAIGPDVSGGNISGLAGHAYKIPAQLCYESSSKDGNGILTFSASTCYGQSGSVPTPPAAPTGLSAVVH